MNGIGDIFFVVCSFAQWLWVYVMSQELWSFGDGKHWGIFPHNCGRQKLYGTSKNCSYLFLVIHTNYFYPLAPFFGHCSVAHRYIINPRVVPIANQILRNFFHLNNGIDIKIFVPWNWRQTLLLGYLLFIWQKPPVPTARKKQVAVMAFNYTFSHCHIDTSINNGTTIIP